MESLIVISKVKKFIKEKGDINTSAGFFEPLNQDILKACRDAVAHAQKLGRKTVMGKDFNFFIENPTKKSLLPLNSSSWFSMLIYLGVQWWSCYLFDGGGAETSRFTAVKTPKDAIKAALTPFVISFIISFFMTVIFFNVQYG